MQTIDFHGILAFAKQLDGDPFDMGIGPGIDNAHVKWREGAWGKCSACGRLKTKMAFSSSQQKYGTTKRCRICINNDRASTEKAADLERSYQANNDKWRADKAWVERILDETFPDKHKTTYDDLRSALIAHWDAIGEKGFLHTQISLRPQAEVGLGGERLRGTATGHCGPEGGQRRPQATARDGRRPQLVPATGRGGTGRRTPGGPSTGRRCRRRTTGRSAGR